MTINEQNVELNSIEINKQNNQLFYGQHIYGDINIIKGFELDNNYYIIVKESNDEWVIKPIIIDTIITRKNKEFDINENIILNLNNADFSYKNIENMKYYLQTYGTLDQTLLKEMDLNLTNTNFYATNDQELFDYLLNLKQNNKSVPLNTLVINDLNNNEKAITK